MFPSEIYQEISKNTSSGTQKTNEVLLDNDKFNDNTTKLHVTQHELIHSASTENSFIKSKDKKKLSADTIRIGYRYRKRDKGEFLQEGLTEITNIQLYQDNNAELSEKAFSLRTYEIIFVSELIKDIARKVGKPKEEILAHFQRGMFEGDMKSLKIITDVYKDKGNALKKIMELQDRNKDIIETAKLLNIQNIITKINNLNQEKDLTIDITDHRYLIRKTTERNIKQASA